MDRTETYIKMCEKAEKIQKDWKKQRYNKRQLDIYWDGEEIDYVSAFQSSAWNKIEKGSIWLPRQDQLQEMVRERTKCAVGEDVRLAYMFHNWMTENDGGLFGFGKAILPNPSMGQLWLCFVMKELYQKRWIGDKWIKIVSGS